MQSRGNAGIRFLIAVVVITLALFVEYAFSKGGVLRWMIGATSPPGLAPVAVEPALEDATPEVATAEAPRPSPPPVAAAPPPKPAPVPAPADEFGALPVTISFEDDEAGFAFDARGGDGIGARTTDGAHGGRFALFSQASEAANRGWPGWFSATRYALAQGGRYVFRAYAVSPDGANAWLDIGLYDKSGAWLGGRSTGCTRERPGRSWQEMELRYLNDDPRVAFVRLSLLQCLNNSKGRTTTLYFDDVSFRNESPQ